MDEKVAERMATLKAASKTKRPSIGSEIILATTFVHEPSQHDFLNKQGTHVSPRGARIARDDCMLFAIGGSKFGGRY